MTPEQKAAYARGYAVGKRRKARQDRADAIDRQRAAFRQRAFLAALPACVSASGWKAGEKPITTMVERTALAWDFADESLKRWW